MSDEKKVDYEKNDRRPTYGSGFDCPAIGIPLPRGTTFEYDSQGMITRIIPPKEGADIESEHTEEVQEQDGKNEQ